MNAYLDSSVLLRLILGEAGGLQEWRSFAQRVTSDLSEVEALRTLDRLRLKGRLAETQLILRRKAFFGLLDTLELVEVTRAVLRRASETFPVSLGTLDAIHVATALLWQEERGEDLAMATHDRALAAAAAALRMKVVGV